MRQTLIELFTSKKFLAALTAIIVYLAGRFGFDVDTAALDRIYAALLAYVGAQAIADHGKSAAQLKTAALQPARSGRLVASVELADPERTASSSLALDSLRRGGGAPLLLVLLLGLCAGVMLPACSWTRAELRAGGSALIDCAAADHARIDALIADLGTKRRPDGSRDWAAIEAGAIAAGVTIGGCALAELVDPAPAASSGLVARVQVAGDDDGRAALEHARARWGGDVQWRTSAGVR